MALGEPSEETQYALDYFKLAAPRVVASAKDEAAQVMFVDHNEFQQSVADIADVTCCQLSIIIVSLTLKRQTHFTIVQNRSVVQVRSCRNVKKKIKWNFQSDRQESCSQRSFRYIVV